MPSGLIEQEDGVSSRRDGLGDFCQMEGHRLGVAAGQDQAGTGAFGRADGPEDIGRACPLVVGRTGPCSAPGPPARDLVFLSEPRFVLEPNLYRLARRVTPRDFIQAGGEVFLNAARASSFWAWWRGRADSLR